MNCFGNNTCETKYNDTFGRYVIASRDIKAGELLLCEQPAVHGPYWDSPVCCLNCYTASKRICSACKIAPLCASCTVHNAYECELFAASKLPSHFLYDNFDLITPLRCLILASDETRANAFSICWQLESHCAERRDTSIWRLHGQQVVKPLLKALPLLPLAKSPLPIEYATEAFVQRICGILDVNSFEVRTPTFAEIPVRGLYALASLLPHDCVSNTFITVDAARNLRVFASMPIKAGETVYNNYTSTLLGTASRREHLWIGKYFRCQCPRCLDPTELGTYFSSLSCRSCPNGIITSNDNETKTWSCNACPARLSDESAQQRVSEARSLAASDQAAFDVATLERVLVKQTHLLSSNHYLVFETKQKLAAVLRSLLADNAGSLWNCVDEMRALATKVRLCEEMLPVLRILKPGISRLTAIALYEYFTALSDIADRKRKTNAITSDVYSAQLIMAERLAKECVSMLVYEPRSTPEGQLAQSGMQHLKKLRKQIANLKKISNAQPSN